jgi:hypothetical protein
MKKILTAITVILAAVLLSNCNGGGGTDPKPNPIDSLPMSKEDSIELYNFLHLFPKPTTVKAESATPVDTAEFHADSAAFVSSYLNPSNRVFDATSSYFTFPIYDFYHNLQTDLGLQNILTTPGSREYSSIRMYPALDTTVTPKQLYLVLMGEKTTSGGGLTRVTMLTGNHIYTVRNNVWSNVVNPSAGYDEAHDDILAFQKFWQQHETVTSDNMTRSTCFSISEYYDILKEYNMIADTNNAARPYKLRFYPCLKDKKLHFVVKGMQNNVIMDGKDPYNNMDPCPTKCPTSLTEIKF